MSEVYRQAGRGPVLWLAAALLALAGCSKAGSTRSTTSGPALQPRSFELGELLASRATAVDSPTLARLLAAAGLTASVEPPPAPPSTLFVPPDGFRVAAVAPHGDRIALVRELDPDTTEVLLHDRVRGETRLLLPLDRDGRFLPQRFSADGSRLLLFSDEIDDTLQLEILHPDTGERSRRPRPGCEALRLDTSPDGAIYALQWSCRGAVESALFDAATGEALGPLPLPDGTRLARALPAGRSGGVLYEIASARYPRDLMFADRLDPDANARPLSFGLAPGIAASDLVAPVSVELRVAGAPSMPPNPAELWWPSRPGAAPPALIWMESDVLPPAWQEFHPFLQFLANHGVVVLRLRLRGSQGLGKRFRHAADGRLVDAGLEDLDAARAELANRGVDPLRIAVLGEGSWCGALAATALVERPGRFVAAADLGGDPDPLGQHDTVLALAEPARTWWLTRLGDPATEAVRRDRARMRLPTNLPGQLLFLAGDPAAASDSAAAFAALWEFLRARLGANLAGQP